MNDLSNTSSKNFVIMMYNDGTKLKIKVVRQAVSHIKAFYASYTSRLNLSLEDLSANLNVCIRYGSTSNPKSSKNVIKMHQQYRNSNGAKYRDIDSD